MDEITITLPLPHRALNPNARQHWAAKAREVRVHRQRAWAYAKMERQYRVLGWDRAETEAAFYLPDRRRRDVDNLAASLKPYWDGIADAGVVADDAGLTHSSPRLLVDRENPRVELTIRRLP